MAKKHKKDIVDWNNIDWDTLETPTLKSQGEINRAMGIFFAKDTDEYKQAQKEKAQRLYKNKPWLLEQFIAASQKRWKDPAWAEHMTEILVAESKKPERCAKVSKAKTIWHSDPENKKTVSAQSKLNWKDPAYVEKVMASQRIEVNCGPYGVFASQAQFLKTVGKGFIDMRKEMPHLYYALADGPGKPTTQKVLFTPLGEFRNKNDAFEYHMQKKQLFTKSPRTQKGKAWTYQIWWKWVLKNLPKQFYTKTMIRRDWDFYYKNSR